MKSRIMKTLSAAAAVGMAAAMCASLAVCAEESTEEPAGEEIVTEAGTDAGETEEAEEAGPDAEDAEGGGEAGGPMGGGGDSSGEGEDLAVPSDNGPYSLDLRDYAGSWELIEEVVPMDKGEPAGDPIEIEPVYMLKNVVYCTDPVHAEEECLTLFVPAAYMQDNGDGTVSVNPEGIMSGETVTGQSYTYTGETAPIYFINGVDGYRSAKATSNLGGNIKGQNEFFNYDYTNAGFIYASPSCRGCDSDPEYDGYVPSGLVDLKAAVRFLKANDDVLAGDSNRIISVGGSAGGGMSALLGSTGNSPDYEEALEAIGAADATDDVYAAMCYCPVTDMEHADELNEFLHYGEKSFTARESTETTVFDEDTLAVQTALFENGIAYVQSLDLARDLGDDGRSGAYYEDLLGAFESSLSGYLAMTYDNAEDAQAYIDENVDPDGTGFVTYDPETGEVTMTSIDDLTANYTPFRRMKGAPGFDVVTLDSNENIAFSIEKDGESAAQHFSIYTADAFQAAGDDDIYEEYMAEIDDDMQERVYLMNPMNYIADENSDNAPYWRFCSGSADGDLSSISSWLLTNYLETYGDVTDVEYLITWDMPHGTCDYHITDQVAWAVSITAE